MQRLPPKTTVYVDDQLVKVWRLPDGTLRRQGKRVPHDCPLTPDEIRVYVDGFGSTVKAVAFIRNTRQCGLREALDLLDKARRRTPLTAY